MSSLSFCERPHGRASYESNWKTTIIAYGVDNKELGALIIPRPNVFARKLQDPKWVVEAFIDQGKGVEDDFELFGKKYPVRIVTHRRGKAKRKEFTPY